MTPNILNTVGLSFDIFGVIGLFRYGLPPKINSGGIALRLEAADPNEVNRERRYTVYSWCSLSLIIVGFALQIWANWV